jgi:hypothetical protein
MGYTIEHDDARREPFAEYRYRIYKDGQLIGNYWHDYRGDDHGIEFLNGRSELSLPCPMIEFLLGGGPEPLTLSARAVAYIKEKGM